MGFCAKGEGGRLSSRAATSRRAARCRSTPTAADCRAAIRACTACSRWSKPRSRSWASAASGRCGRGHRHLARQRRRTVERGLAGARSRARRSVIGGTGDAERRGRTQLGIRQDRPARTRSATRCCTRSGSAWARTRWTKASCVSSSRRTCRPCRRWRRCSAARVSGGAIRARARSGSSSCTASRQCGCSGRCRSAATLVATNKVVSITDKGEGKGAIAVIERELRERADERTRGQGTQRDIPARRRRLQHGRRTQRSGPGAFAGVYPIAVVTSKSRYPRSSARR